MKRTIILFATTLMLIGTVASAQDSNTTGQRSVSLIDAHDIFFDDNGKLRSEQESWSLWVAGRGDKDIRGKTHSYKSREVHDIVRQAYITYPNDRDSRQIFSAIALSLESKDGAKPLTPEKRLEIIRGMMDKTKRDTPKDNR